MKIFLSYALENKDIAEQIQLSLIGSGYKVFWDQINLDPSSDYHSIIQQEINSSDLFVFLISPFSIEESAYSLTELKFARDKWPHPKNHVLPVIIKETNFESIPNYLNAVTALRPVGNIAAEVVATINNLSSTIISKKPYLPFEFEPKITRRQFIKALLAFTAGTVVARDDIFNDFNKLKDFADTVYPESHKICAVRRQLFLPIDHDCSQIIMASDHPWLSGLLRKNQPTDVTKLICESYIHGLDSNVLTSNDFLFSKNATSVFLGSPTSNVAARNIFQYKPESDNNHKLGFFRKKNSLIKLRWEYLCGKSEIHRKSAKRIIIDEKGKEIQFDEPIWAILDTNPNFGFPSILKGHVDKNRQLIRDYLLISQIPNLLDLTGYDNGSFFTFSGGANALGTRGLEILNKSKILLDELYKETRRMPLNSWQALYIVELNDNLIKVYLYGVHPILIESNTIDYYIHNNYLFI